MYQGAQARTQPNTPALIEVGLDDTAINDNLRPDDASYTVKDANIRSLIVNVDVAAWEFRDELPRTPTGELHKGLLKEKRA